VSETQAEVRRLMFNLAKTSLVRMIYPSVISSTGIDTMMEAAPASKGGALGALGGLASGFGGKAGGLGALAGLAGGFSKLGMDGSMISKFVPVILSFVKGKGGDAPKGILEKVLK
jgi:hypothetical protein